jgi:hypothetical protein
LACGLFLSPANLKGNGQTCCQFDPVTGRDLDVR